MTTDSPAASKRGPGRPRDPEVERRLRRATLEVLSERGFSGLTVDRICERAGAPRATFYRRWSDPVDAVTEAYTEAFSFQTQPDTGSVVADLVILGQTMVRLYNDPVMGSCMSFLVVEARVRPKLVAWHEKVFPIRRAHSRAIVERAMARGEISASIDPDLIIDVLSGLAMNNHATGRPVTDEALEFVVRRLLGL